MKRTQYSKMPEYRTWASMKNRCLNPRNSAYRYYGKLGITICDRWLDKEGFIHFLNDMGPKPSESHTIDRIDTLGNYEPNNCRWSTRHEQTRNRRNASSHIGVTYYRYGHKWLAQLDVNRRTVLREYYDTFEEALAARRQAESKYLSS